MKTRRPILHLIPQAHLDPVWLWPWRDGAAEGLTTLQSAVDRLREFPRATFTRSTATLYRWVQEQDPRLFAEIRRLVRNGRWEVIGGWIEQPDCNLPSTESFVRQALLARRWFSDHLGAATTIGYNVDSFGHHAGLPQLLRQTGCRHYVFMRPELNEALHIPNLFHWEGPDGSRVLTQRVPVHYAQAPDLTADGLEQQLRVSWRKHFSPDATHGIFWFGVGNHGGGPTREMLTRITQLQSDPSLPELRFSSVAAYFAAIEASPIVRRLPVIRGDLLHKFRGCYAATSAVKKDHRRCEVALRSTEQIVTLLPGSAELRSEQKGALSKLAWQLGDLQFHDILAGSCVHAVQEENRDRFGTVADGLQCLRVRAVHRLARTIDTHTAATSVLFVGNALPWARRALVQLDTFRDPHRRGAFTHLALPGGRKTELQWLEPAAAFGPWLMPWGKLTVPIDLPASGYVSADLIVGVEAQKKKSSSSLRFSRREAGATAWRTGAGQLLRGALRPIILPDAWDTWGHDLVFYSGRDIAWRLVAQRVIADGPHVRVHRQQLSYHQSALWLDFVERPSENLLEIVVHLNWQERRQLCALEIPLALSGAEFVVKSGGGVAERPTDGSAQPGQEWCAVTGSVKRSSALATVIVASDGGYNYSCDGSTLRLVVARGAPFAEHKPVVVPSDRAEPFSDQGWQTRRFFLRGTRGDWRRLAPDRFAAECLHAPEVMLDNGHPGSRSRRSNGWSLSPDNVSLLAAKPAEQDDGLIFRVQEMSGRHTRANLISPNGRVHRFQLRPWQIATWHYRSGAWRETDCLETRLQPPRPEKSTPARSASQKNRKRQSQRAT